VEECLVFDLGEEGRRGVLGPGRLDCKQLVWILYAVGQEDVQIEHREDDGDEAEAQADGSCDGEGSERSATERRRGEPYSAQQFVEPETPAHVTTRLFGRVDPAKRLERAEACCIGRQSGGFEPLGLTVDVQAQFFLKVGVPAMPEEK